MEMLMEKLTEGFLLMERRILTGGYRGYKRWVVMELELLDIVSSV